MFTKGQALALAGLLAIAPTAIFGTAHAIRAIQAYNNARIDRECSILAQYSDRVSNTCYNRGYQ